MIKKIVGFALAGMLTIAFTLKLLGIDQIEFGDTYYRYLKYLANANNSFSFEIPSIPLINTFNVEGNWTLILNFLINVVNGLSGLVNVIITILNMVLQVFNFIVAIVVGSSNFLKGLAS